MHLLNSYVIKIKCRKEERTSNHITTQKLYKSTIVVIMCVTIKRKRGCIAVLHRSLSFAVCVMETAQRKRNYTYAVSISHHTDSSQQTKMSLRALQKYPGDPDGKAFSFSFSFFN